MFSNRYVRTIMISRVLLQLAIWVRNFAVLLYVTDLTNNNSLYVSLISVVEFGPIFLFAIIGGAFADRWRPKRTMAWSDLLSALSVIAVLIAVLNGEWIALLIGTFVSASLSQFSQPSAMKLYKRHVSDEQLPAVMALSQTLVGIFTVIGPMIGAAIYLRYGIEASLWLTVVLFLGSSLVLTMLLKDLAEPKAGRGRSIFNDMAEGLRYIRASKPLRTLGSTFAVSGLAIGLIQPLAIFIVMEKLGQDKAYLQWFMMANGAAMLVGGALLMNIAKKVTPQSLLAIGLLVSAVCTIGVGGSESLILTFVLQAVSGLFYPCIQVGIQTMLMRNTEGPYIGRVSGAIMPIFMGMMVIGMMAGGLFKNFSSLFIVYTVSGCLLVVGAALLLPVLSKKPQSPELSSTRSI
ncbi:MFS transporter [Paenibacillus sp. NPDC058071]|uniref:MFS transporter n=1 Tax=Paenibacillus sp. NPDC058071 TaxID=3346326 RepID=UPI0036DAA9C8